MQQQKFGPDITKRRADDLDRQCLRFVRTLVKPSVLDLGCGAYGLTNRLTAAGASVTAVDIVPQPRELLTHQAHVTVIVSDIRNLDTLIAGSYDVTILQRVIHYLTYEQAVMLLTLVREITKNKLFISVSGLQSALGEAYQAATQPITRRFSRLGALAQKDFSISEPVCLYTKDEFKELLATTGWSIEQIWTSQFGNHKAVCINNSGS